MAKLYYTKDIRELVEKKIDEAGHIIVRDKEATGEQIDRWIREIRIFQKYAYEMLEEMEDADIQDDAEMAEWRAKKTAEAGDNR